MASLTAYKDTGIPLLDIFHTKFIDNEQKLVHKSRRLRNLFTEEYFLKKEWDEPKEYSFGPLKLNSITKADDYISRHYGKNAFDFAYQVFHHDSLASMSIQPLNLISHIRTISKYDLPRRTYLEDRSPIQYDARVYENDIQKINKALKNF